MEKDDEGDASFDFGTTAEAPATSDQMIREPRVEDVGRDPRGTTLSDWLGAGGFLSRLIPGFRVRHQQLVLAEKILGCRAPGETLLAEAPCGVGKSMAYLVPAFMSRRKVLVATHNIALQEQLIKKDCPILARAAVTAGVRVPVYALFKGRSNYLCGHRLRRAEDRSAKAGAEFWTDERLEELERISAWALATTTGDRSDCEEQVGQIDPRVWSQVGGDSEGCKGCGGGPGGGRGKDGSGSGDRRVRYRGRWDRPGAGNGRGGMPAACPCGIRGRS